MGKVVRTVAKLASIAAPIAALTLGPLAPIALAASPPSRQFAGKLKK